MVRLCAKLDRVRDLRLTFCCAAFLTARAPAAGAAVSFISQWLRDPPGETYAVQISGNYAYLANGSGGLQIMDISNFTNLVRLGGTATAVGANAITLRGNYAYVCGGVGLVIVDISSPAKPRQVGQCATPDYAVGVALLGDYAYVAD